ncbi:MAG: hypothetical protein APR54_07930 [Candidatus Cloacimonas sp. SDB]|nr:MAG: hypothetical protein APR54_07930 [Candidatus Cloacimonas sp. SDB]
MKLNLLALTIILLVSVFSQTHLYPSITWEKTVIDEDNTMTGGIAIGRPYIGIIPSNDNYLYCASLNIDRNLVEYSFENNQWNKNIVLSDMNLDGIIIASGRNDNYERIYAIQGKKIYEVWCSFGVWFSNLIFETTDAQINYLIVGDGRNDGINRVYLSSKNHTIYELTFTGPGQNDWDVETINQDMYCEDIGLGKNDSINRIYGVGGNDEWTIYELTYNPIYEIWEKEEVYSYIWETPFTYPSTCWGVSIGKTRIEDDLYRIYYLDVDGDINELFWNGNSWENTCINVFSTTDEYGYGFSIQQWGKPFAFGEFCNNEPPTRMIFINGINSLYYFIYKSGNWERIIIEEIGLPATYMDLEFGCARNSGYPALYSLTLGYSITEFYPE